LTLSSSGTTYSQIMATSSNSKSSKAKPAKAAAPAPVVKAAAKPVAPSKPRASAYEPTQEEIQTRAYEIYLSEGCKEGNDLEYWLRAEKELRARS
jgi:hypothetical protein